eukprot:TRINITY_DN18422_c0_g1_i2.p1 TRINITY_DN18422_c0_g1~~TRINITY_DN18422_c0_g1_i2.p1  ORF type:complete len:379 (+),score=109.72 TRINITY_DN18422_c0_g1_i2:39-1175(+)
MLPLCMAASRDDVEVLRMEEEHIRAWAESVGKGIDEAQKAEEIRRLVEDVAHETNETDHNGLAPLHWAVLGRPKGDDERHGECIQLLLKRGAAVEAYSNKGWTPLHYAAHSGDLVGCQKLLEGLPEAEVPVAGSSVEVQDPLGQTPLHRAAIVGSTECLRAMLQCDRCTSEIVNIKDDMGRTVLHWCCLHNRRDMVTMLIKKGVNIGIVAKDGRMAEELAALKGHRDLVVWLTNGLFPKSENPHLLKSAALVKRLSRGRAMDQLVKVLREEFELEELASMLETTKEEVMDMTEINAVTQSQPDVFVPKVSLKEQAQALRDMIPRLKPAIEEKAKERAVAAQAEGAEPVAVDMVAREVRLEGLRIEMEQVAEDLAPASI